MTKILKKIVIVAIAIIAISIPNYSKASTLTDIMDGAKTFLDKSNNDELFDKENEESAIDTIYYIGLTLGIVIAIIIGVILGIQFITSGVEGQAKVKEKLIPYFIGCFVVFGAFGIWKIVYNVLNAGFAD